MKVVIVEDEGITALFLKEAVEDFGHEVVGVFDEGSTLCHFLENHETDVIFMDIHINGSRDGIQVADLVHRKHPYIAFVFLTSYKDSDTIESAKTVKPMGYLIKPVSDKDIEAILMVVDGFKQLSTVVKIDEIYIGKYTYHLKNKTLHKEGILILLSKNEHLCLRELLLNQGLQVSTEQLLYVIWGEDNNRRSSLRELTYRLRKKLPELQIANIPNIGYILTKK